MQKEVKDESESYDFVQVVPKLRVIKTDDIFKVNPELSKEAIGNILDKLDFSD